MKRRPTTIDQRIENEDFGSFTTECPDPLDPKTIFRYYDYDGTLMAESVGYTEAPYPFYCYGCSKHFSSKRGLLIHAKRVHNKKPKLD
jgi:hypothetical protein